MFAASGCNWGQPPPPAPVDSEIDTYSTTARLEFENGEVAAAAASYAKALDRAREMDDSPQIAATALNLAIVDTNIPDYPNALELLDEAEREARRSSQNPTDILLVRARTYLAMKDPAQASASANSVLSEPATSVTDSQRLQAHVTSGLAACESSDSKLAAEQLAAAKQLAAHLTDARSTAMIAGLTGELAMLGKDYTTAATAFDQQASLNRQAGNYRSMEHALAQAGRAYVAAGNDDLGADRLYRAARAASSHNDAEAIPLAQQAHNAAVASGDESLTRLAQSLLSHAVAATQPDR